jgi:hypothetical protein
MSGHPPTRLLLAGLTVTALLAGCASGAALPPSAAPTATAAPAATPNPSLWPWLPGITWTPAKVAAVSGTIQCGTVTAGSPPPPAGGPVVQGPVIMTRDGGPCTAVASDPRVTGPGQRISTVRGLVIWMDQQIEGPEGTWSGPVYGVYDKEGVIRMFGILVGSGAYEGFIYAVSEIAAAHSTTADTVGVIQPGAPPPGFPVAPSPAP